ncbi:MAG: sigma-70 family RNA polymerase sigma factor, partial [Bacteroidota bacterium]
LGKKSNPLYLYRVTSNEDKNFGLTEVEFQALKEKLRQGDQSLFEHVFLAHYQDCMAYVVKADGATEEMAYDATMDALLAFRTGVAQGKIGYGNLRFLLTRMARQYYYKKVKREAKHRLEELEDLPISPDVELETTLQDQLEKGWKTLGEECRQLLRAIYFLGKSYKELAELKQRTAAALRKQKQRCIEELRDKVAA